MITLVSTGSEAGGVASITPGVAGAALMILTSLTTASSSTTEVTPMGVLDEVDRAGLGGVAGDGAAEDGGAVGLDFEADGGGGELLVPLDAEGDAAGQVTLLGGDLAAVDLGLDALANVLPRVVERPSGSSQRAVLGEGGGEHGEGHQGRRDDRRARRGDLAHGRALRQGHGLEEILGLCGGVERGGGSACGMASLQMTYHVAHKGR